MRAIRQPTRNEGRKTESMQPESRKQTFFGWWIIVASIVTFGIAVGIPYYNLPFFYDYFQKTYHWRLDQITLGFPLAALLTIWVGPVLIPRFSPRKLILAGTALTAISLCGFGLMGGSVYVYYLLYFIYTVGYLFSGPIPHQILVSYWFKKKRGMAMGIVYVGVGLFGALGARFVRPITESFNFHTALIVLGRADVCDVAAGAVRHQRQAVGQRAVSGRSGPPSSRPETQSPSVLGFA